MSLNSDVLVCRHSFCQLGVTLETGIPMVLQLVEGDCTPQYRPWRNKVTNTTFVISMTIIFIFISKKFNSSHFLNSRMGSMKHRAILLTGRSSKPMSWRTNPQISNLISSVPMTISISSRRKTTTKILVTSPQTSR